MLHLGVRPDVRAVAERLDWMTRGRVWPNGRRQLLADAFGLVVLVSLFRATSTPRYLDHARRVVHLVDRVLGRRLGIRMGDGDGDDIQDFRHLTLWMYGLSTLGKEDEKYRERALHLVREIHSSFVQPKQGVFRRMAEDLSGPCPGTRFGPLEPFCGYAVYRRLGEKELSAEIGEMKELIESPGEARLPWRTDDLGALLWLSHFFQEERWAARVKADALAHLDRRWLGSAGAYSERESAIGPPKPRSNLLVALGLVAAGEHPDRVHQIRGRFDPNPGSPGSHDPVLHLMGCATRLPGAWIT